MKMFTHYLVLLFAGMVVFGSGHAMELDAKKTFNMAIKDNDVKSLKELLEDTDESKKLDAQTLQMGFCDAAHNGKLAIIKLLVAHTHLAKELVDVVLISLTLKHALSLAAKNKHFEICKVLLKSNDWNKYHLKSAYKETKSTTVRMLFPLSVQNEDSDSDTDLESSGDGEDSEDIVCDDFAVCCRSEFGCAIL